MRLTLLFCLIICISAAGQPKPLFKIISCSEGVMVDSELVNPGDIIYSNSNKINIPQTGYLGILTIEGYAHLLTKETQVAAVYERIKLIAENERRVLGSIHRSMPNTFKIIGVSVNEFNEVFGDSILIAFRCYYKDSPPFKITFFTMFDKVIDQYEIDQTWKVFSTDSLFKVETALICQISSEGKADYELAPPIKRARSVLEKRVRFDLERLSQDPVSLLALYEINRLSLDHIFQLYKIEASNKTLNLDEFLTAYLARIREKYDLKEYMTK
jgi:hypothetical protein